MNRKNEIPGSGNRRQTADFKIELLVIFALLVSLGFPGNFAVIYGKHIGTIIEYAAFVIELLVMLLSSGSNWLDVRIVNLDKKYFMLYVFVAVVFVESMLVSRYPSEQFITCARLFVTLLFAIWLQEQFTFERMIELLCFAQMIFLIFVAAFIVLHPGEAFESGTTYTHALRGLYSTKNNFAYEVSFGILIMISLIRLKKKRMEDCRVWWFCLIVQLGFLAACQATGAVICVMSALVPLCFSEKVRLPLAWGYIAVNIAFLFAVLTLMPSFEWIFEAMGKDATLTGRIPLWNQIILVMMGHNTLTGFGYGMFWRDSKAVALVHSGFDENSFLGTMTTGAHNALLELWLNIGLIGIAAYFAALLYSMRNIEEIPRERYLFSSIILTYLMMNGLVERTLSGNYDYRILSLNYSRL